MEFIIVCTILFFSVFFNLAAIYRIISLKKKPVPTKDLRDFLADISTMSEGILRISRVNPEDVFIHKVR